MVTIDQLKNMTLNHKNYFYGEMVYVVTTRNGFHNIKFKQSDSYYSGWKLPANVNKSEISDILKKLKCPTSLPINENNNMKEWQQFKINLTNYLIKHNCFDK